MYQLKMTSSAAEGQGTHCHSTRWKYGVHFCFNGQEIQNRLIGHFNYAFYKRGIKTTIADLENARGEDISQTTLKAIEESRSSIVVFSHKFAFSTRCLDELVKILDCRKRNKQLVRPLFFQIDPSVIRNLKESCGEAIAEHREKFKNELIKVKRWRLALYDAANLSGCTFKSGCEYKLVQGIVEEISKKLNSDPLCNADCLVGLKSHVTEPQTLMGPGSCDDVDTIAKNGIGGIGVKCKIIHQNFPNVAQLKPFFTSSDRKESEKGERFIMVQPLTSTTSTSKERGELVGPKMSGIMQYHDSLNVQLSEGTGMKKRKRNGDQFSVEAHAQQKQTWAEITYFQLLDSRVNQVSIPRGTEDGLISRELNRNQFDFPVNDASVEELFASLSAENTTLSAVQDAGSMGTRTSEEMRSAMLTLQTFVSKRLSELIPEGSKFMEHIQNNVLSFCADDKISQGMGLIAKKLLFSFTQWSQHYEDADNKLKTTTADLSKVAELEDDFAAVVNESKKAVSAEKEVCIQLAHMLCRKRELEEQLKAVTAEITDLSSSRQTAAARKRLLLDKGSKLKTEKDNLIIRLPRIRAELEAAMFTQENIEAEWLKLGKVFNESLISGFGSW